MEKKGMYKHQAIPLNHLALPPSLPTICPADDGSTSPPKRTRLFPPCTGCSPKTLRGSRPVLKAEKRQEMEEREGRREGGRAGREAMSKVFPEKV